MFPDTVAEFKFESVVTQLYRLKSWLADAAQSGVPEHKVERHIFDESLRMGAKLLEEFFNKVGPGDQGPTVTLENGETVDRWEQVQNRPLVTIFGQFTIPRFVYGTRPGQKIELVPTDQRLQLPEGDRSYLLQDWNQMLCVEDAFGQAGTTMRTIFNLKQSVDTLEHGNQQMAEAAPVFRESQPAPDPKQEKELLVDTVDNKGIPMVRPVKSAPVGAHRKKGEKANKKQMATVGCVYSVDRHVRTAEELVAALFRDPQQTRNEPPKACQKRYWAELSREVAGELVRAQDAVFEHMRDDVKQRRRPGQTLIHLSDGQNSLADDRKKYLPRDENTVDILDLLHVSPRLWEAAHLFHHEGSDEATAFVRERMLLVLKGKAKAVIAELRQKKAEFGLAGTKAVRLTKLCNFLENNLRRMRYHKYLREGYPIATGVIEGACRHVIKDRMERAGMRWKVPGAEAMLELRTIRTNGDWATFQEYRVEYENKRLYPHMALNGEFLTAAAA